MPEKEVLFPQDENYFVGRRDVECDNAQIKFESSFIESESSTFNKSED